MNATASLQKVNRSGTLLLQKSDITRVGMLLIAQMKAYGAFIKKWILFIKHIHLHKLFFLKPMCIHFGSVFDSVLSKGSSLKENRMIMRRDKFNT